jgi:hypothetical protein
MLHKTGARTRAHICGLMGGLALTLSCGQAQASEISAVGPLEGADCPSGVIQVLGITFRAADAAGLAAVCAAGATSELPYVSITGLATSDSTVRLSKLTVLSKGQYVPGASPVYVRGAITRTRLAVGEVVLSGASIRGVPSDFRETAVEVLGTQPVLGGVILANSIGALQSAPSAELKTIDSSTGSGKMSSTGSGKLSSTGSGKLSSTGSGVLSSTGSGILSSTGSGTLSSTGSGKMSSTGSGLLSSTGSGVLSSTGSGVLSSTGSGVLSSTGSGTLSSTGSGTLSSTGSGAQFD